jgi:uncharacterized protein involved in oxidation of intracellular sulfur
MKIGIIINTNEPETVWNAFRFGVTSLLMEHGVKVFLLGKGVESESLSTKKLTIPGVPVSLQTSITMSADQDKKFNVKEQIGLFGEHKGLIFACGTCLKIRQMKGSEVCPISTMNDMLHIVEESDKVLVFG